MAPSLKIIGPGAEDHQHSTGRNKGSVGTLRAPSQADATSPSLVDFAFMPLRGNMTGNTTPRSLAWRDRGSIQNSWISVRALCISPPLPRRQSHDNACSSSDHITLPVLESKNKRIIMQLAAICQQPGVSDPIKRHGTDEP